MKIELGIYQEHRKGWTSVFINFPVFYPEEKNRFSLRELKEIVREMEKMELAND